MTYRVPTFPNPSKQKPDYPLGNTPDTLRSADKYLKHNSKPPKEQP